MRVDFPSSDSSFVSAGGPLAVNELVDLLLKTCLANFAQGAVAALTRNVDAGQNALRIELN